MKYSKDIIILLFFLIRLSLNSILIDKIDINILDIDLDYYKNENKYLLINYYDNTFHYSKKYDTNENLLKEEKNKHENKIIKNLYYYQKTDNYVSVVESNSFYKSIQVFYNNKIIELNLDKYREILSVSICDDNTLLVVQEGKDSQRNFLLYNYPPKEEPESKFTDTFPSFYSNIWVFGLKNTFAKIFYEKEDKLALKIINKDSSVIASKSLSTNLDDDIVASYIDLNNKDLFLLCFVGYSFTSGKVKCAVVKYNNNQIILGKYLTVFNSCPDLLHRITINLIQNNKMAIGCTTFESVYISFLDYSSDQLKPGIYFDKKIINKPNGIVFNPYINYYQNKGYILYYLYGEESENYSGLYKTSLNPSCENFDIILNYVNEKQILSFNEYINSGFEEKKMKFKFIYIDKNVAIYLNNKKVKLGNEYSQDKIFEIESKYSPKEMKIIFSISNQNSNCSAKITFKSYDIKIRNKTEKCIKTKNGKINNLLNHELVNDFKTDSEKIEFKFQFENEVTNNELFYIYNGKKFKCKKNNKYDVICQSPIPKKEIKSIKIKNEYKIESKFVCENSIFIDTLKIIDPYILEVFDAKNLKELTQTINKNYNPAKIIKNFDLDMITYYYWFSCYSHCTIEQVQNNKCCNNYLKEWEIFDYKSYDYTFLEYLKNYIKVSHKINENLKNELLKLKIEVKRYLVFKNDKYKKYVLLFGGYDNPNEYLLSLLLSGKKMFEIDEKTVEVNDFLRKEFKSIENDIFSIELIDDITKNKDYQIIFIGHSFGGAIATLSIYSFVKNYIEDRDPVLITFGQPRVGNEEFAKKFNQLIPNVYRIAKTDDKITMIPPIKEKLGEWYDKFQSNAFVIIFERLKQAFELISQFNGLSALVIKLFKILVEDLISNIKDEILEYLAEELFSDFIGYCHIGGLYLLNKEENSFIHCRDFGNEETNHYICKNYNWNIFKFSFNNHNYFLKNQNMNERCLKEINFKNNKK